MLILCAGMIRSGSTLQYNLVRSLLTRTGTGEGEGFIQDPSAQESLDRLRGWAKDTASHAVKVHRLPPGISRLVRETDTRVCYIYRDIRDVAVSLKHKLNQSMTEMSGVLDRAVSAYEILLDLEPVLRQQYEKVVLDILTAAEELAEFLDLSLSPDQLREVVEENSLDNAQKKIERIPAHSFKSLLHRTSRALGGKTMLRRMGIPESILRKLRLPSLPTDSETLLHRNHISKNRGARGVWRKDLEKDEIAFLDERYGTWLARNGYDTPDLHARHGA